MILEFVFWLSVLFVAYAYLGYPLLLLALSVVRRTTSVKADMTPPVSFIVTAHNEGRRIRRKLDNVLAQDYPKTRLEIIVASDCSTDATDDIVRSYEGNGVYLARAPHRIGKEAAQKLGLDVASGGIIVFSDAATILPLDAVTTIVKNFADSSVGCVSSVDRAVDPDGRPTGEGVYLRYEMFLRKLEARVNTLVGLSGCFFAARREVCRRWPPDLQSDFHVPLNAVRLGLRAISDAEAVAYYEIIPDQRREFARKIRTVVRGLSVFMASLDMLNPFRFGLFSWQLISHKLCRWLVPFALLAALVSNALLAPRSPMYMITLFLHLLSYGLGALGLITRGGAGHSLLRIPAFFVLTNLAILTAWCRYTRGERITSWSPSPRGIARDTSTR